MPNSSSSSRRENLAVVTMVVFLLSQCFLPQAVVLQGSRPAAHAQDELPRELPQQRPAENEPVQRESQTVPAPPVEPEVAPLASFSATDHRISLKALDVSNPEPPTEAQLRAAGGLGGELSPIGNADTTKFERELDMQLKLQGVAAGLRSTASPVFPEGRMVANAKALLERAKDGNLLFARAVNARNRRRFPETARLLEQYIDLYGKKRPFGPWLGEAHLHLAMDAKARMAPQEALQHYEAILNFTEAGEKAPGYAVRQKAKQGKADLQISNGEWALAAATVNEILRTEKDWRRWTWAAAWKRNLDGRLKVENDLELWACGNRAVAVLLASAGKTAAAARVKRLEPPRQGGFSAAELIQVAGREGMTLRGFRTSAQHIGTLATPFIVHYGHEETVRQPSLSSRSAEHAPGGHFLVVRQVDGARQQVTLYDPQLNKQFKLSYAQFSREWSGNGLARVASPKKVTVAARARQMVRPGIVWLSRAEMKRVVGGCCCFPLSPGDLGPPDFEPVAIPQDGPSCPQRTGSTSPNNPGSPGWLINKTSLNQFVDDTPMWYRPAIGPSVEITQSYNSQDALNQSTAFGNKWTFNYASYLLENPGGNILLFMPGGKQDNYSRNSNGTYTAPPGVYSSLRKNGPDTYTLTFPSGDQYLYGIPAGTESLQPVLLAVRDRWGNAIRFGFDSNVRLTTITDAENRVSKLTYDGVGHIVRVDDPFGRSATFRYDGAGNLTGSTDMGGYSFTYAYDSKMRMTRIGKPEGKWTFRHEGPDASPYDGNFYPPSGGKMGVRMRLTITDPLGKSEEYFYSGSYKGILHFDKNAYIPNVVDFNNYSEGRPYTQWGTSIAGQSGKITSLTTPSGGSRAFSYDPATGLVATATDSNGRVSKYTHNRMGQVISFTDGGNRTTRFNYAANGVDLVSVVNAKGATVFTATYNAKHQPLTITDALNNKTTITYTGTGDVASVKSPLGVTTLYTYAANRLASVTLGGVQQAAFTYDAIGRAKTVTDAAGITRTLTYDNLDRVTSELYPDSTSTTTSYATCCGVVDAVKDRAGRVTEYEYDPLKRLLMVQEQDGLTTRMTYDNVGNLIRLNDARGASTRFAFDASNRLIRRTYADGTYEAFAYDKENNLIRRQAPGGKNTAYRYDLNQNLTAIVYPSSPAVKISYDTLDRPILMVDAVGTTRYSYDLKDRLIAEDGPWANDNLNYSYNADGNRSALGVAGASTVSYSYDTLSRLKSVAGGAGTFNYGYEGNLLKTLQMPNGTKTSYGYDNLKRLNQISNQTSTGADISAFSYVSDNRDLRTTMTKKMGASTQTIDFKYDQNDQLTNEKSRENPALLNNSYDFDLMGNRIKTTDAKNTQVAYAATSLNQYKSYTTNIGGTITTSALAYDVAGNLKSVTTGAIKNAYTFDDADRLVRFTPTTNGAKSTQTEFLHDGLGRKRIKRELKWISTANSWQVVSQVLYLYDGMNVVQERNGADNSVQVNYTRGLEMGGGIGGLLARTAAGANFYYHYDGGGNVTDLTDKNQATVASYLYDAFGNTISATGAQAAQPYRFSTKEYVSSVGLYDYGFRFYSPGIGRWINRDPIRENGGINLHGFVKNNPISSIDALGLQCENPCDSWGKRWWNDMKELNSATFSLTKLPFKYIVAPLLASQLAKRYPGVPQIVPWIVNKRGEREFDLFQVIYMGKVRAVIVTLAAFAVLEVSFGIASAVDVTFNRQCESISPGALSEHWGKVWSDYWNRGQENPFDVLKF